MTSNSRAGPASSGLSAASCATSASCASCRSHRRCFDMKIHKGDEVIVLSGKNKDKTADELRAIPSRERVFLEGVNVAKRHPKPTRAPQQGGVIDKFMP